MKKLIQILLLSLLLFGGAQSLQASHIVGGEIEVKRVGSNLIFTLNLYFDEINGNAGARDPFVNLGVYGFTSKERIWSQNVPLLDSTTVSFTNPAEKCVENAFVETESRVYTVTVPVSDIDIGDQNGYYIIYDRCCRNNSIVNIVGSGSEGMLFYTRFPCLDIINSTPEFNKPVRDYACLNVPFYTDFSSVDPDGDSLVYSLTTPLGGLSDTLNNAVAPSPPATFANPEGTAVIFSPGINLGNVIPGSPALSINQTGRLEVTPSQAGIHVFGVKIEEFRNGVKIGEMRRDYQVLVQQCPFDNTPPTVDISGGTTTNIGSLQVTTVKIVLGDLTEDICLDVEVDDPQLNPSNPDEKQNVTVKEIVFLTEPIAGIEFKGLGGLITDPSNANFQVCIPACPNTTDTIKFDVIVQDDACPQQALDTSRVIVILEVPPNDSPVYTVSPNSTSNAVLTDFDLTNGCVKAELTVGDTLRFDVNGFDPNGDSVYVFSQSSSVDLVAEDFNTNIERFSSSSIDFTFNWTPDCDNLGEGVKSKVFDIEVAVADIYGCGFRDNPPKGFCVQITLNAPPDDNIAPQFLALEDSVAGKTSFDIKSNNPLVYFDTVRISRQIIDANDAYSFRVNAFDINGDNSGDAFRLEALGLADGMIFQADAANAVLGDSSETQGIFSWNPICENIDGLSYEDTTQLFVIDFVATDARDCFQVGEGKIQLELLLIFEPDGNEPPVLEFIDTPDSVVFELLDDVYCNTDIKIGELVRFDLEGTDPDLAESVFLRADPIGFTFEEVGMVFEEKSDILNSGEKLEASFSWIPDCNALNPNQADRTYEINFIMEDNNTCDLKAFDTVKVKMTVKDIERGTLTPFANAFSPNGDGVGDSYFIENLPIDNCADSFVNISIVNRWGKEVFRSEQRDFSWEAAELPTGVYYYHVKYLNSDFKGTVHIVRGKVSK